jgi:uncharacterized protein (DUF1684 family)
VEQLVIEPVGSSEHQDGMPPPEATMRLAISSPEGPGMSRSRTAMSYVLTPQLQSAVAVTGDVCSDRVQTQAIADGLCQIGLVLEDTRTLR